MTYSEIMASVASDVGLSRNLVDKIYKAYWRAVREHIKAIPLKENLTKEEFMSLRPNVNIPSIGKFYITYDHYKKIKESYQKSNN